MNTADTIAQRDAYNWANWCVDDDEPRVPGAEPDPMASAQSRRAWRSHHLLQNTCRANRAAGTLI